MQNSEGTFLLKKKALGDKGILFMYIIMPPEVSLGL
jgi:hypothetical protein